MNISRIVKSLRKFRSYHRVAGLSIAIILFISAITGILLAFKKDIDIIQPPTAKGISTELSSWLSIEEIAEIAKKSFYEKHPEYEGIGIDRIDARPSKGIAKVIFEKKQWEVQVDCTNGTVLSVARRHSDWIEHLHDGSIISDGFKLFSMNFLGLGSILLIGSGLWMYFGPRKIRNFRKGKRDHK